MLSEERLGSLFNYVYACVATAGKLLERMDDGLCFDVKYLRVPWMREAAGKKSKLITVPRPWEQINNICIVTPGIFSSQMNIRPHIWTIILPCLMVPTSV